MRTELPVRPAPLAVMLDIAGRDVTVVGGGAVAARRVATLVEAGARVRVVAPAVAADLEARATAGALRWEARPWRRGDCADARLVVVATDDPAVNAAAAQEARAAGALLNDATDAGRGDVQLPAVVRRGAVTVAIGTGGAAPALAALVRARVERCLPDRLGDLAALAATARQRRRRGGDGTAGGGDARLLARLLELLEAGRDDEATALAASGSGAPAWS